jgi:hypothetical protein
VDWPGHIAESDVPARDRLVAHMPAIRDQIGAERGWGIASGFGAADS